MTYYTMPEGSEVLVLKTRNGWRQIKSMDGKVAWVGEDYVGEI
jgi:SH3-like domain-containing protein